MDQFFAFHSQTLSTVDGIKNCFAVFAAGLVRYGNGVLGEGGIMQERQRRGLTLCECNSAVCMCLFVERAKKCLDFGVTLYFIDLLVQCFYSVRCSIFPFWLLSFLR